MAYFLELKSKGRLRDFSILYTTPFPQNKFK